MKLLQHLLLAAWLLLAAAACSQSNKGEETNSSETTDSSKTTGENSEETTEKNTPSVKIDNAATARAQIMAGISPDKELGYDSLLNSPAVKQHFQAFNQQWQKLDEQRLSKIPEWRDRELESLQDEGRTLFYPFSGPDFLNAYTFFPNCDNYLMFGLEPDGQLVDINNMPPNYLASLREALSEIFQRNYFITSYMSNELWGKGVLPIVNIFMARTGNQIVSIERFYLSKEGEALRYGLEEKSPKPANLNGITIEFLNKDKSKSQRIYYFGTDVADEKMKSKMELVTFIKSFERKITFIKSASYILHNINFKVMRDVVLQDTDAVLQDDTGVRYQDLVEAGWEVQLYGKYARPIRDFGSYTYQPALQAAFDAQKDKVRPLNFTFGYHWNTDNTSLLLGRNAAKK